MPDEDLEPGRSSAFERIVAEGIVLLSDCLPPIGMVDGPPTVLEIASRPVAAALCALTQTRVDSMAALAQPD